MKEITFVRHAKSSWKYDVGDKERPLKKRGITDADLVSEEYKKFGFISDVVFSSPAKRAFSTCKIFARRLNFSEEDIIIHDELYDFGGSNVINFIKSIADKYSSVMIFGHNHAFTSIVNSYGNVYIDNLPTSGLVRIQFDIESWKDLKQGNTTKVILPRDLK